MVTLFRFNIFLIFVCIFGYMSIKISHYIQTSNIKQFNETMKTGFFMAILSIIALTLFPIELSTNGLFKLSIIPFKTTLSIIFSGNIISILANIIGNTIMFIPLGFFSYINFKGNKSKSIKLCLYTTLFVETVQIILPARLFDIDDIMLNFLGGYIGVNMAIKFIKLVNNKTKYIVK